MKGAPLAADRPHPGHIAADGWSLALWVPAALVAHIAGAAAITWIWSADAGIGEEAGFGGIAVDLVFDDGFGEPDGNPAAEAATAEMPTTPVRQAPDDTPQPVPFAEPEMPVPDQTDEILPDPVPEPEPAVAEIPELPPPEPEPPPPESVSPEPMRVTSPTAIGTAFSELAETPAPAAVEPTQSLSPDVVEPAEPADTAPAEVSVAAVAPWAPPPPQRPAVPASFVQRPTPAPAPAPANPTPPATVAATAPLGSDTSPAAGRPTVGQAGAPETASVPGDTGADVDGARVTYERAVLAWFERHKTYPPTAQRRGIEGQAGVLVTIADDGSITAFSLTSSSGSSLLDDAVQRMVVDASPVPPIPPALGGRPFSLRFAVQFALH